MKKLLVALLLVAVLAGSAFASDEAISAWVEAHHEEFVQDWLTLVAMPGKSREERQRGDWIKAKFEEAGMENVTMDEIGNVYGMMKGNPGTETVVINGHHDTVFPNDTPLNPVIKEDGWLYCPGAGDCTPSNVALYMLKRALDDLNITPAVNIVFLSTVQEEVGLAGMKHYLANVEKKPDMVVITDSGLGGVGVGALGINWYKVYANTPAGHTLSSLGKPSAVKSIALAITEAYKYQQPRDPVVHLNMGVIGGGTVENAIAEEAWVTVDIRSQFPDAMKAVEDELFPAMEKAIVDSGAAYRKELTTVIPAGQIEGIEDHKLVKTILDTLGVLGYNDVKLSYAGSTDGNAAIALGIPTINIGIKNSRGSHSLEESADVESAKIGMRQLLMFVERLK